MNSRELIQRYLQAVGFWLPRAEKHDILAELEADLAAQVDDRAEELGRPLTDAEVAEILRLRGRPATVALGYLPQRSLIGPGLYPIYAWVMKLAIGSSALVWLLTTALSLLAHGQGMAGLGGAGLGGAGLGSAFDVLVRMFLGQAGIITLVFAILERSGVSAAAFGGSGLCRAGWDPLRLPAVRSQQATRRRTRALTEAAFHGIALMWLLAVPSVPFLILGPSALLLHAAPVWHTVYPFLVVAALLGMVEPALVLARPDLPWLAPAAAALGRVWSLGIVLRLLRVTVFLTPAVPRAEELARLMNLTIHLSVYFAGIGLAIGLVVSLWQAARAASRPPQPGSPAPMRTYRI